MVYNINIINPFTERTSVVTSCPFEIRGHLSLFSEATLTKGKRNGAL